MRYARAGLFATAILFAATVGCYQHNTDEAPSAAQAPRGEVVRLTVDNQAISDFDLYAVADGEVGTRLGTIMADTENDYTLTSDRWKNGTISIVARALAGHGVARSGTLPVSGGNSVDFTIQPNLKKSYATVRYGAR
jgi:hypothetical protein